MKTQVFKNSEPVKSSDSMMVFTMIVFWGLMLFAVDNVYVLLKNGTLNLHAKHENGLHFGKMTKPENTVGSENAATQNQGTEIEFSMEKMQEYLIPENEPELTFTDANSIAFPAAETAGLAAKSSVSNDDFLNDLKIQANEKTNEAVEFYALEKKVKEYLIPEDEHKFEASYAISIVFPEVEPVVASTERYSNFGSFLKNLQSQAREKTNEAVEFYALEKKVKEYLTVETELPLQLEEWMISEKCWCPEMREPMALSAEK